MKQDEEIMHGGVAGLNNNLVSTCDAINRDRSDMLLIENNTWSRGDMEFIFEC